MTFSPDDRSAYMPPPPANQDHDQDHGPGEAPLNIPPLRQTAAEAETRRADLRYRFGGIMVGVAIVAALMGGAFWWGYEFGRESVPAREPPRVAAAPGPVKEAPSDPGGMRVPHQDKLVFDGVTEGGALDRPDRQALGRRAEEPLARPPADLADDRAGALPRVVEVDKTPPAPPVAAAPPPTPAPAAPQANMPAPPPPLRDNQLTTLGRLNGATPAPGAPMPITPGATTQPSVSTGPLAAPAATATMPTTSAGATPPQQTAAVAAPPPSAAARAGGFKIQLAAHRTVEAAREGWLRVQASNRDLLGGLEASYSAVDLGAGKGVFHRLQAGPFADATAAQSACEALRTRNLGCIVVRP